MSRPGSCDTGCAEHKLVLVRAATLDILACAETTVQAGIAALRPPAEELLDGPLPGQTWPVAYAAVQAHAREALHSAPDDPTVATVLEESAEPAVTWWCDRCGGVDAPQPCLGICVWRPIDWARHDIYEQQHERTLCEHDTEQRLHGVLQRLANTTPRAGQHRRSWEAFAEQAAKALRPSIDRPRRTR